MKKYLEPDLTVIKFNLQDVLGASTPKPKPQLDPDDPNNDDDYTPWFP